MQTEAAPASTGLIGHDWAVAFVARSHQTGPAAHAYLLVGPGHGGKFTTALAIGRALLCGAYPPCGNCRQCLLVSHNAHPDLRVLEMPEERKTIPLKDVHEFTEGIALRPLEAGHKVYIIRDADDLSEEGANALLKTIEEPPPRTVILLTALSTSAVPATIVSRCQVLTLRGVAAGDIAAHLVECLNVSQDEALAIARASRGRPGWAILAAGDPAIFAAQEQHAADLFRLLGSSRLERIRYAGQLADLWSKQPGDVRVTLETWADLWHIVMLQQAHARPRAEGFALGNEVERAARGLAPVSVRAALTATLDTADALARNANPRLWLETYMLLLPRLESDGP